MISKFYNKSLLLIILVFTYLSGNFNISIGDFNLELRVLGILSSTILLLPLLKNSKLKSPLGIKILVSFYFIFLILSLISVVFSAEQIISFMYVYEFLLMLLLILITIGVTSLYKTIEFFHEISLLFIIIGIIFSMPIFITFLQGYQKPLSFTGSNVTTRLVFFSFISSIYRYCHSHKTKFLLFSVLFFITLILIGSRGGLLAAIICILLFMLFKMAKNIRGFRINYRIIILVAVVLLLLIPIYDDIWSFFSQRFINTTFQNGVIYTSGRNQLYDLSLEVISNNPILGSDLGIFYAQTGLYPHNLILELLIDFGILGVIIFGVLLLNSFYLFLKFRNTPFFPFNYLPLYMIIVHMFSGSYYDFRYFFLWIIPLLVFNIDKVTSNFDIQTN